MVFLSTTLIGIFYFLSEPSGEEGIYPYVENNGEPGIAADVRGNENEIYRRFIPEHQMWCAPGPEVSLGLKTNLLYWPLATPNAGIELFWRRRWSLSIEGVYARWLFDQGKKYYYLAAIAPELRYWLRRDGRFNGHCLGAGIQLGEYDIQFGRTGEQADFAGFGLSYGYALPVSKVLNIEFGLGIGYVIRKYIRYEISENELMSVGDGRKAWIGPTKIGISCVWHIGNKKRGRR